MTTDTNEQNELDPDVLSVQGLALLDWLRDQEHFTNRELLGLLTWAILQLLDQMNEPECTARTANFLARCFKSMFQSYNALLVQGSDTYH
jgi:hypothetical protein